MNQIIDEGLAAYVPSCQYNFFLVFKQRQDASNKNGSFVVTVDDPLRRNLPDSDSASWSKTVTELYLPGTPAR